MGARNSRTSVAAALAALGLTFGVAACSSGPPATAGSDASPSVGQKIENLVLLGTTNPGPAPARKATPTDVDCPRVDIQPGTGSYQLYDSAHPGDPFQVRYQARFGPFARECNVANGLVTVRIGISGRLIVGPKGEAGHTLAVPVRVALLDRDDKPVFSRLTVMQVTIPAGTGGQDFREVVDAPPMPIPPGHLYGWSIKVGFDTKQATPARKRPAHRHVVHHRRAHKPAQRQQQDQMPSMTFH